MSDDRKLTGRKFHQRGTMVPMMLVSDDEANGDLRGWLVYLEPGGRWLPYREASPHDREMVEKATSGDWYGECPDCKAKHTEARFVGRCSACRESHLAKLHAARRGEPWDGSTIVAEADTGERWWYDADALIENVVDEDGDSLPRLLHVAPDRPNLIALSQHWSEQSETEDGDGWALRPASLDDILSEAQAKIDALDPWWYQVSNVRAEPTAEVLVALAEAVEQCSKENAEAARRNAENAE